MRLRIENNIILLRKLQIKLRSSFGKLFGPGILKYIDRFVAQGHYALFPIPNKAGGYCLPRRAIVSGGIQGSAGRLVEPREMTRPGTVPSVFLES
jgi:hypothetical protein